MKSTHRNRFFLCLILVFYFLSGCTINYIPKKYPIKSNAIPHFTSLKPITIINALKGCPKEVIVGVADPYTHVGDLSSYTQTAVDLLVSELEKKNIPTLENGKKVIRLEVLKASLFYSGFTYKTNIILKAEIGSGYDREYHVINSSGLYDRSIDGAVTKSVTALLNDPQIIAYIEK